MVTAASGGTFTPGVDLRDVSIRLEGRQAERLRATLAGVSDPVVDALVEAIDEPRNRAPTRACAARPAEPALKSFDFGAMA